MKKYTRSQLNAIAYERVRRNQASARKHLSIYSTKRMNGLKM